MLVHMFWRGPISLYEQACMASFVKHGFRVVVHTYERELLLPRGVQACDARAILPEDWASRFTQGGYSQDVTAFSDLFRYEVLFAHGGLWADADMLCLQPLAAFEQLQAQRNGRPLFGWEDETVVNGALIMASQGCSVMRALADQVKAHDPVFAEWGAIGPHLITRYAQAHPEQVMVLAKDCFYPMLYSELVTFLLPEYREQATQRCAQSLTVHLWNSFYDRFCLPKSLMPPQGSFLHQQFSHLLDADDVPCLSAETTERLFKGTHAINQLKNLKYVLAQKLTALVNEL